MIALLLLYNSIQAQELTRRSFLGIQMEAVTDDVRRIMELPDTKGVLINRVVPGSTAADAGFQQGDVLLKLNDTEINTPNAAVAYVGSHRSGEAFTYELIRKNKKINGKAAFAPYPTEQYADLEVIYAAAKTESGLQRMILTKPKKSGKLPVVVFLTGYGCYSLDTPLDTLRSEIQLLNTLARAGYLTVRAEKPGVGDGAGVSRGCGEIGFQEEARGYTQMIETLKKRPDVDASAVYIFGHSMGGAMAPIIAQQTAIKGIIAYGTVGSNFMEYFYKTRRTIAQAYQMPPDSTDAYIKNISECVAYYFMDDLTSDGVAAKRPDCAGALGVFDDRSRQYTRELYAFNPPLEWKKFTGKSLLFWGEGDFISSKEDHEILVDAINFYRPGHAELATVKATHGMETANNFQQAVTNPGDYNPEVGKTILNWLKKQHS